MAGIICTVQTAEQALTAATAKTIVQIVAPTNQRLKVLRWGVGFDGISPTAEPVQVRLLRQTSAIGGTPAAITPVITGVGSETPQATAAYYGGSPTEPSAGNVLSVKEIHPQSSYDYTFPLGQEILVPGGGRLGIECTAPANVNVRPEIVYEE